MIHGGVRMGLSNYREKCKTYPIHRNEQFKSEKSGNIKREITALEALIKLVYMT
jgi:hypothetical protein